MRGEGFSLQHATDKDGTVLWRLTTPKGVEASGRAANEEMMCQIVDALISDEEGV